MADQKYTATLTGKGAINNAFIYLETLPSSPKLAVPILLYPKPGQKKVWTNAKISLAVHGNLDYELQVNAAMGTEWSFELKNNRTKRKVIELEGETGEDEALGYNVSRASGSVTPE